MSSTSPFDGSAPRLGLSRLLLIVTGSYSAANMPFWLTWLNEVYPHLQVKVVVTTSAERFVTLQGLSSHRFGDALRDEWPLDDSHARHVEWAQWADGILVYPATFHFLARLALGLVDSPALLAAQCTTAPVIVAPGLPPGGWQSPACAGHVAALSTRPNTVVVPPRPGVSKTTGRPDAWAPALMPAAIRALEGVRQRLAAPSPRDAGPKVPDRAVQEPVQ
ncbi:flavoprotein [Streptomyces sp. IBSBF 2806]|uniref:flavoprotein n=1 Tax=Streptomyces sp. IBSBF 2806 TaxID=2903529 RepID=UPI002FDBB8BC